MADQKLIDKLNDALRHEWTGVAQYSQAAFLVQGVLRPTYSELFFEKIVALGGVPAVERNSVKQSQNLKEMLEFGLEFEKKAVELYNEALELAEGDRALVVLLEDILKEEQEGVDDLSKLLRDEGTLALLDATSNAG